MIPFKKHIPNTITCCNLIAGCIAIVYAFYGKQDTALLFILIGAGFDFFDGMVARLLHVSSPIGKELDSLADDITFGAAPAMMIFTLMSQMEYPTAIEPIAKYLPFTAFIIAAFSALRLAKFNLDERQTTSFIGLPTPANALFWGSLIVGAGERIVTIPHAYVFILILIAVTCWLLVAEIPMFALKFKQWGWKGNEVRYLFILSCIPILLIFGISGFALIIAWYVILSAFTQKS